MKKYITGLLLCVVAGTAYAEDQVTVAAFEYPPIYQNDKDKGLSGDLVAESFKAVGINAEFSFYPVKRMVQMVSTGQAVCGIGAAAFFDSPEVKPNVTVVAPLNYVSQVLFYNVKKYPQGIKFDSLADLADYHIGVLEGSGIKLFLAKEPSLKLETNNIHEGSAQQMQLGRIDLWAIVDLTGLMYMKKLFPNETADYRYSKAFNIGDVSVACSNKLDPKGTYAAKFKEGLATIKKNGIYMQIMAKYYGGKEKINKETLIDDMK